MKLHRVGGDNYRRPASSGVKLFCIVFTCLVLLFVVVVVHLWSTTWWMPAGIRQTRPGLEASRRRMREHHPGEIKGVGHPVQIIENDGSVETTTPCPPQRTRGSEGKKKKKTEQPKRKKNGRPDRRSQQQAQLPHQYPLTLQQQDEARKSNDSYVEGENVEEEHEHDQRNPLPGAADRNKQAAVVKVPEEALDGPLKRLLDNGHFNLDSASLGNSFTDAARKQLDIVGRRDFCSSSLMNALALLRSLKNIVVPFDAKAGSGVEQSRSEREKNEVLLPPDASLSIDGAGHGRHITSLAAKMVRMPLGRPPEGLGGNTTALSSLAALAAGWYCLKVTAAPDNCLVGAVPFVVVEGKRKGTEYGVPPTWLRRLNPDVSLRATGVVDAGHTNPQPTTVHGATVNGKPLEAESSDWWRSLMWAVPKYGLSGNPVVSLVTAPKRPGPATFPAWYSNAGWNSNALRFPAGSTPTPPSTAPSNNESGRFIDPGDTLWIANAPTDWRTIDIDNGRVELFSGRGTFWVEEELRKDYYPEDPVHPLRSVWHHHKPGRRRITVRDLHTMPEWARVGVERPQFISLSSEDAKLHFTRAGDSDSLRSTMSSYLQRLAKVPYGTAGPLLLHITASMTVETLDLPPEALIVFDEGVVLTVHGYLQAMGTLDRPITLTSAGPFHWGGLVISPFARCELIYTIVSFTGGVKDRVDGTGTHIKDACPAVTAAPRQDRMPPAGVPHIAIRFSAIANGLGPGIGVGKGVRFIIQDTILQDLAQGGESVGGEVEITRSHLVDFPFVNHNFNKFVDGDNDGFYFRGGAGKIEFSVVMNALDDCVDSASSKDDAPSVLKVDRSRIANCQHEGVALSGSKGSSRRVEITNSAISHAQQAIENGYSPDLHVTSVRDCVLSHNAVALRYGDNYPLPVEGIMEADGVTFLDNGIDVLNHPRGGVNTGKKFRARSKKQPKELLDDPASQHGGIGASAGRIGEFVWKATDEMVDVVAAQEDNGIATPSMLVKNSVFYLKRGATKEFEAEKGKDLVLGFQCGSRHYFSGNNTILETPTPIDSSST